MTYAIAMVKEGFVFGVLLMEDDKVKRAWIDPEFEVGICEKMEYHNPDPQKVMESIQKVLDVRYIPEVDPKDYDFDLMKGEP